MGGAAAGGGGRPHAGRTTAPAPRDEQLSARSRRSGGARISSHGPLANGGFSAIKLRAALARLRHKRVVQTGGLAPRANMTCCTYP